MPRVQRTVLLTIACGCIGTLALAQQPSSAQTLTLQDALTLAKKNSVAFQAALTDQAVTHQDTVQARAGLLPSVTFHNQYLYTQGSGVQPGAVVTTAGTPRFIANNAVHEYASQGIAEQTFSLAQISDYRRTHALEAAARGKAEIATRGLVVTVVQDYYSLLASQRKYANVQLAATEAAQFLQLVGKLETGGEVAHADVIKAQIQSNDRQRDLREARLAMDKAKLDLAVLLFPNFDENYSVVDDAALPPPLESFEDFAKTAQGNSADVRVASASAVAAGHELSASRAGYLPALTLDYFYGIDAPQFASHGPNGSRNLGYAASATLNIPVWNWGATHSKVVQAGLRRQQAERELSLAQRKLLADIRTLHAEAAAALSELDILKESADLAAESLRLINLRYQGGEATVLEVVDAQNTLTQARNAWSDGTVRYRTALANLQTLTGKM